MKRALLTLMLVSCGRYDNDGWPVTACGLSLVGPIDVAAARRLMVITSRVFQGSTDSRLHGVCEAANGYRVELREFVTDPRHGAPLDGTVGGFTRCDGLIAVEAMHYLPHELAHVAQNCSNAGSGGHAGWDVDVEPQLQQVLACTNDDEWEAARADGWARPCAWLGDAGCPTICPPGARDR